jgi:hypothetical protein
MGYMPKSFSWGPPWKWILKLALLPFHLSGAVQIKQASLKVPVCARHRYHWVARTAFLVGSFLFVLLITLPPIACVGNEVESMWIILILGFTSWLAVMAALRLGTVRAIEITDRTLTLAGVAGEFKYATDEVENR